MPNFTMAMGGQRAAKVAAMTENVTNLIGLLIILAVAIYLGCLAALSIARYMHRVWEAEKPRSVQPDHGEYD